MKTVSVVVPVKNSQRTFRRTVGSLLDQDYPGHVEVILVGDRGDATWNALGPELPERRIRIIEVEIETGGRDSNFKRNAGLAAASGDVLCLTDSDMVLPPHWLSAGVALLEQYECVGGPMISLNDGFWGSYVDRNPFASKTPRMEVPYVVSGNTVGRRGHKLPITANVLFTRAVYARVGGLDANFVHSYEDYEFFQRVVDAGFEVLCTPALAALHYHRQSWRDLVREYHRSGRGCAQFVAKHPHSPFGRSRLRSLVAVVAGLVALIAQPFAYLAAPGPPGAVLAPLMLVAVAAAALALGVICVAKTRSIAAFGFPAVTLVLGLSFSAGLLRGMRLAGGSNGSTNRSQEKRCSIESALSRSRWSAVRGEPVAGRAIMARVLRTAPTPAPDCPGESPARSRARISCEIVLVSALLLLAAALRLWSIKTRPGFDWDEPVYAYIATSLADGDGLFLKPSFGVEREPYLFHPPFYFYLLAGWFKAFGAGIAQARVLAALASLVSFALLYPLVRRRWGWAGLLVMAVLVTDGWLVFTNRVGWMENVMFIFVAGGMLAYDAALRRESRRLLVTAALLLGFATVFKHVGGYALLAVLIHWGLTRRHSALHRQFFAIVTGVVAIYAVALIAATQTGGHNVFLDDVWVQLQRFVGVKSARGSIPASAVVTALVGPYKVFFTTLLLSGAALLLVAWRTVQIARARGDASVVADPLLFSWALAAAIAFGALKLKMAHYFMMIEIPLLLYLASEVAAAMERRRERGRRGGVRLVVVACGLIVCANLVTFDLRFASRDDNALGATASYMEREAPPHALVTTEESVGSIVPQPYCKFTKVGECYWWTRYLIVYRSATQAPPDKPMLNHLLRYAVPLARFDGFKERITVYRGPGAGPVCAGDRIDRGLCDGYAGVAPTVRRLRGAAGRADLRFGRYPRLVRRAAARAMTPLPSSGSPAVLLLGTTSDGRAIFWNLARARVSGGGRCRPSRAACREIVLRAGEGAHLEVPTVTGGRLAYDLKLDRARRAGRRAEAPAGRALVRRLIAAASRARATRSPG